MSPDRRSVLALDVGRRRIGLAGCDPLGLTVTPLPPLRRGPFPAPIWPVLEPLARQRRVEALVVGLPLDQQQRPTPRRPTAAAMAQAGRALAGWYNLPLALVNEFASSWDAAELHGLHGDRSGALDSAAAALLLEQWLGEGPEPVLPATPNFCRSDHADPS